MRICEIQLLVLWVLVSQNTNAQNTCGGKLSCSECLRIPNCAWCSQKDMDPTKRCFRFGQSVCPAAFTFHPQGDTKIVEAQNLTGDDPTSKGRTEKIVQISPQRISLKLRINEPRRIKFAYAQAEDYPIDLYYLMDLSQTMKDDKEKLSTLGRNLVESMSKATSNFRIGFGSFVDKIVMPYARPDKLLQPCPHSECTAVYSYRNHMALNNNTEEFIDEVKKARLSGNLDDPEGGFDALMQAIVCEDIGWRKQARHLVVFSTDSVFHYAGEGKLGGITKPNDGKCHLDEFGFYTYSTLQDYPSVSQINNKVKEYSVNVIFAVTEDRTMIYERVRDLVEGSSVGLLSTDSSNVVSLVEEEYKKISSSLEMQENVTSSLIQFRYFTRGIEGREGELMETRIVNGLKVGSKVNFEAEVLATECPQNPDKWKQTLRIYPVGMSDSLIVDLELLCDCECEHEDHPEYEKNSENCKKSGDLVCGVCRCDETHFGHQCECDSHGEGSELESESRCRQDNTSEICSGKGSCVCGVCICHTRPNPLEIVSGTYCECDNFTCDYSNGEICSGPSHGVCSCGQCECMPGWNGTACECSTDVSTCIVPGSNELCSGRGICECGTCSCDKISEDTEDRFSGKHCQSMPLAASHCEEYKDCVMCRMYQRGKFNEEECAINCSHFLLIQSDYIQAKSEEDEILCVNVEEDGCQFKFVYSFNGTELVIRAQEKIECLQRAHFMGFMFGIISVVVLIGLAILMAWKLFTSYKDRRECARFEKQVAGSKMNDNPLYKDPLRKYTNPLYERK